MCHTKPYRRVHCTCRQVRRTHTSHWAPLVLHPPLLELHMPIPGPPRWQPADKKNGAPATTLPAAARFLGGWAGAFALNAAVVATMLVAGLGMGGYR